MTDGPTLEQLQTEAKDLGMTGYSKLTKPDLQAKLADFKATAALEPGDQPLTPEQTGRPELRDVAEQRAADRQPRVIGAAETTDSQEG